MLQPTTIPSAPDEIAARVAQMSKEERYFVNGVIVGISERITPAPAPTTRQEA